MDNPRHDHRYRLLLVAARGVVMWERLWRRLWPAAAWAGLFLTVALLDLLPGLAGIWHLTALVVFAAGFGFLCYRGAVGLRSADETMARRRIENDSGLKHRPLSAIDDRLYAGLGDEAAETLWKAHLRRIAKATQKLRLGLPSPGLIRHDRYAIRVPVMLLLVIALAAAGGDATDRLKRAFKPQFGDGGEKQVALEIWITPPAYTKMAPLFLNMSATGDSTVKTITIPAGSKLLAHANGVSSKPGLVVGSFRKTFAAIGEDGYQVEAIIEKGDRIAVKAAGRELASWPINVVPDNPPVVSFSAPPKATGNAYLRIAYKARDDYGVSRLEVVMRLDGSPPSSSETRLGLPFSSTGTKKVEATSISNLSAHPWAGMKVLMHLEAVDGRGQKATSKTVRQRLPERKFNHPVARAIIKQRRKLAEPLVDRRDEVVSALRDIMANPERFADNAVIYLSLGVARSRLIHGRWPDTRRSVEKLLWDTALKIEDGDLSIARQNLKSLQERLMQALDGKQPLKNMENIIDEIAQALDQYLSALGRKTGPQETMPPLNVPSMGLIREDELKGMIEKIRDMLRAGSVDAARQMLEELQRMTDNIRTMDKPPAGAEKAYRMINRLRSLGERQGELLDRTFQLMNSKTISGKTKFGQYADQQDKLRLELGDLMLGLDGVLGNIPKNLGKAEQAMRSAAGDLASNILGPAVQSETEALDQLRQAFKDTAEKIARRFGGAGASGNFIKGGYGKNRDPFGRLRSGNAGRGIGSTKIPKVSEVRRSRKILQELRRRAGDGRRKKPERDYIKRLLRQF